MNEFGCMAASGEEASMMCGCGRMLGYCNSVDLMQMIKIL